MDESAGCALGGVLKLQLVVEFNDQPGVTKEQIIAKLKEAGL